MGPNWYTVVYKDSSLGAHTGAHGFDPRIGNRIIVMSAAIVLVRDPCLSGGIWV